MSANVAGSRVLEAVREHCERELSPEERAQWLGAPHSDVEREQLLELVRWFCRRYPTPLERLAYVRRAYLRWQRTLPLGVEADRAATSTHGPCDAPVQE